MAKFFDVNKAISEGADPQAVASFMKANNLAPLPSAPQAPQAPQVPQQPQVTPPAPQSNFGANLINSAINTGKAIVSPILHPIETAKNLGKLAIGTGELLIPGEQGMEAYPKAVGEFYKQRYGGLENIKKTLYEDPVGAALDASVILGGAGGLLGKAGEVSKIGALTKAGELAKVAGEVVDPLRAVSKLASPATSRILPSLEKVGANVEEAGKALGLKAIKANPKAIADFEEASGTPLQEFMSNNGLYGATAKDISMTTDSLITPLQKLYNKMVRSGEEVPVKQYTDALLKKAGEIKSSSLDPSVHSVADDLISKAKFAEDYASNHNGMVPVDLITNTKSSEFARVPGSVMTDPTKYHSGRIAGDVGIQVLENIAPGSAEIGRKLRDLRTFKDIVLSKQYTGAGSQLFNLLKPSAGGAILGGIGTNAVGLGGVPGLIAGGAGALASSYVNSPAGLSNLSQITQKAGGALQNLPDLSGVAGRAAKVAEVESRINPPVSPELPQIQQTTTPKTDQSSPSILPPIQKKNITGYSQEQLTQGLVKAMMANDKNAVAKIQDLLTIETNYQKQFGNQKLSPTQAKEISDFTSADSLVGNLVGDIDTAASEGIIGPVSGRASILNPYNTKAQAFNSKMKAVAQIVGRAMEGGVLRKEDVPKYEAILPNISDTPEVAKAKIDNVRQMLKTQLETKRAEYLNSTGVDNVLPALQ